MSDADTTTAATATSNTGPRDDRAHWDARYRARDQAEPAAEDPPGPPDALQRLASLLPATGRVVDLAGGDGGGGLFLARRGLEVTIGDISEVALRRAAGFAERSELALETASIDLAGIGLRDAIVAAGVLTPAPAAVTCWSYLSRPLLSSVADELPSGCRFLTAIATTTNLERNARPPARFLLAAGELAELVVGPN
ncbi:MAG: hypothetical protein AAFO29_18345, partial [Actinomycetota bacterium]